MSYCKTSSSVKGLESFAEKTLPVIPGWKYQMKNCLIQKGISLKWWEKPIHQALGFNTESTLCPVCKKDDFVSCHVELFAVPFIFLSAEETRDGHFQSFKYSCTPNWIRTRLFPNVLHVHSYSERVRFIRLRSHCCLILSHWKPNRIPNNWVDLG